MGAVAKVEGQALTEMQARFVEAMLNGEDETAARDAAGYSPDTSPQIVLASEAVQAALRIGCERQKPKLRALAFKTLAELLQPGQPATVRAQAVKIAADLTGDDDTDGSRPDTELSIGELEALIRQKEAQLRDVTPSNGAHHSPALSPTH